MLPPGHIAAGFIAAYTVLKIGGPSLTLDEVNLLLLWGAFCGFVPDLDTFIVFAKLKAWIVVKDNKINHRKWVTHAPILWLGAGLLVYGLAASSFWQYAGLILAFSSLSHFVLDSIQYGVMWLWPFQRRIYALRDREKQVPVEIAPFAQFWSDYLRRYRIHYQWTFYAECAVLAAAALIFYFILY
ncbi:MAG: metal-dependent hydrolase [Parcubacteria group bacterium]|nr:metal-dependent hydrolase [Parcubacteria group bacterium]